jgi:arsenate reductase-like glutaredoxin family protein
MSDLTFYHYPNCSTCKKALSFLMDRNIGVKLVDITKNPPSQAELKKALDAVDGNVQKLFKRPLLLGRDVALVGFKSESYEAALG